MSDLYDSTGGYRIDGFGRKENIGYADGLRGLDPRLTLVAMAKTTARLLADPETPGDITVNAARLLMGRCSIFLKSCKSNGGK